MRILENIVNNRNNDQIEVEAVLECNDNTKNSKGIFEK